MSAALDGLDGARPVSDGDESHALGLRLEELSAQISQLGEEKQRNIEILQELLAQEKDLKKSQSDACQLEERCELLVFFLAIMKYPNPFYVAYWLTETWQS